MTRLLLLLLTLLFITGCSGPTPPPSPATENEVDELKTRMTEVFSALEMHAADNTLSYPGSLDVLIPKYLDEVPLDPVSRQPIKYQKTDTGFLLSVSGDYSAQEAEEGFPKMNQDGFYVLKQSEFPTEE